MEDEKSLKKEIQEIEDIISDDEKLKEYIIKELEEGKKKYPNTLSVNSTRSGADFGSVENWKDKPKTPEDFWNTGSKK